MFNPDWHYRTDVTFGTTIGQTLSVWARPDSSTGGRFYFGFGASSSGCRSIILAPNTTQFFFQTNASWGYAAQTSVSQSYTGATWYYIELEYMGGGQYQGRLYSSTMTLLNTVTHDFGTAAAGGIAIRAFNDVSIDSISM